MDCSNCGEAVRDTDAFCEACGTPLGRGNELAARPGFAGGQGQRCACGGTSFDPDGFCEACGRKPSKASSDEVQAETLGIDAASATHHGRHHVENQDATGLLRLPTGIALAVADGVSTSCHARAAADAAVRAALGALEEHPDLPSPARLKLAVQRAHAAVCGLPNDPAPGSDLAEPQTTLVLALVEGDTLCCAWAGDSRLYVLRHSDSIQFTTDDSWMAEQVGNGMDPMVALQDPNAHCITQALGMRDEALRVHVRSMSLSAGDWVLACSDGLWNYCGDAAELRRLVGDAGQAGLARSCRALVDHANSRGGQDNVTVALYRH